MLLSTPWIAGRLCNGCFRIVANALSRTYSSRSTDASISSAELIAKWQGILTAPGLDAGNISQGIASGASSISTTQLPTEQLRQLCQEAIHVYSTEGAATVVPDRVTDIFMAAYSQLRAPQHKLHFFKLLVSEFGVQRQAVDEAVQLWLQRAPVEQQSAPESHGTPLSTRPDVPSSSSSSGGASADTAPNALMFRLAERLSAAAQPLYMQLLLPVSQHKAGIQFLVNLRADLLSLLKEQSAAELGQQGVALRALDQDLRSALARWFSLGLLQLHRITWEHSPGQLLQRVLQTEAVHKMQHLEELQRRLQQSDRRVFAFTHPSLPGEPLVVLHTAILGHIPCSMDEVLKQQRGAQSQHASSRSSSSGGGADRGDSDSVGSDSGSRDGTVGPSSSSSSSSSSSDASVACFYSISSGQKGLAGVDLGNFLIKKAAQLLLAELPELRTLVTLSPIPGFRAWLITKLRQAAATAPTRVTDGTESAGLELLRESEVAAIMDACRSSPLSSSSGSSSGGSSATATQQAAAAQALLQLVQDNSWVTLPPQQQQRLRYVLVRLCATYLLTERRRNFALDPVAHFHLRNGAQLWRLNWRADLSSQGLSNSCGLMVNYLYDMAHVVANNQRYLLEHSIAASQAVQQLLEQPGLGQP